MGGGVLRFGVDCSINRMVKLGPFVGKLGEERPDRACSRVRAHPVRLKKSWLPVTTGEIMGEEWRAWPLRPKVAL